MKNKTIYLLIFSICCSFFTYYILNDYLYSILIFILTFLMSLKIAKKQQEDNKKYQQLDDIYKFTSLMNLQMFSAKNLNEGYLGILSYLDENYQNIMPNELVDFLIDKANENDFNSFKLYTKAMKIYENEGGNYNKLTKLPYQYINDSKNYYTKLKKEKTLKLFDVCLLYSLWILVVCFLKFSVSDYFNLMINNDIYKTIIFILLIIGFYTFQLCLNDYYNNQIRGL